jgi:hypothetical protein
MTGLNDYNINYFNKRKNLDDILNSHISTSIQTLKVGELYVVGKHSYNHYSSTFSNKGFYDIIYRPLLYLDCEILNNNVKFKSHISKFLYRNETCSFYEGFTFYKFSKKLIASLKMWDQLFG